MTHALLPGSPALNKCDHAGAVGLAFDQLGPGFPRVVGARVGLGAYEAPDLVPDFGCLSSRWRFDEVSGSTALDSADGNPGLLVNGPVRMAGHVGSNAPSVFLPNNTASPLQFGGNTTQGYWFPGALDDVRLYGSPLSAPAITVESENDLVVTKWAA